jgi:hypothetical protein
MPYQLIKTSDADFLAPLAPGADSLLLSRFWESLAGREDFYLKKWQQHRLTPMIYWEISRNGWGSAFSPRVLQILKEDYASALGIASRQEAEVQEVVRSLQQGGIEVILLKGADLRHRVYEDPVLRLMGDMDLMIAPDSLSKGRDILVRMGYHPEFPPGNRYRKFKKNFSYYTNFYPPEGKILNLDLHWELHSRASPQRLTYAILSEAAPIIDYHGIPVKVLTSEHLLLHLSLHILDHALECTESDFEPAQGVLDLAWLLEKLPLRWPVFLREVGRFHCGPQLDFLLQEISRLAIDKVPANVLVVLRDRPSLAEGIFWNLQKAIHFVFRKVPSIHRLKPAWSTASVFFSFLTSHLKLVIWRSMI